MSINHATTAAFERSKKPERQKTSSHLFAIVLMAVFFVVLMIGLAAGVSTYRSVSSINAITNDIRMQTGLLANSIHVNDQVDAVGTGEGPEGTALVLTERLENGTYETRIYQYKGQIVQEFAIAGKPYQPDKADALTKSATFGFEFDGALLTIETDRGPVQTALRSRQEGAR